MTQRRASSTKSPTPAVKRAALRPVLLLLAALALALTAGRQFWGLWQGLPGNSVARLDWNAVNRARAGLTGPAREGLLLVISSDQFTAALQGRRDLEETIDDVRDRLAATPHTYVGRLQLAALLMLRLERDARPVDTWWPTVQPFVAGASQAPLDHFLAELLDAESAVYVDLGLGTGTSRYLPLGLVGAAHGPFLQYLVENLRQVGAAHRAAGQGQVADECERVVGRLLREWVSQPGPAGLRLLAAELLASGLGDRGPTAAQLAEKLRAWRTAYDARAAALPTTAAVLRTSAEPVPVDATWLTRLLAWTGWTAATLALVLPLALVTIVFCLSSSAAGAAGRPPAAGPLVAGATVLLVGGVLVFAVPGVVQDDLTRIYDGRPLAAWLPWVAAGTGFAATVLASMLTRIPARGRARLGRCATALSLLWSVALWGGVVATELAARRYQDALAAPLEEHARSIADIDAEGLLADLRAWHP